MHDITSTVNEDRRCRMGKMGFDLFSFSQENPEGSAAFQYKGMTISMAFSFLNPSVMVFDVDNDMIYEASSVEDAIGWCDNNPAKPSNLIGLRY